MQLHDGNKLRTETFENVKMGRAYAQLYINFWDFQGQMQWGKFECFKNNKVIVTHEFGSKDGNN